MPTITTVTRGTKTRVYLTFRLGRGATLRLRIF